MQKKWIVLTMSGKRYDNHGKGYVSHRAAQLAAKRRGEVPVETRPLNATVPHPNDAAGWDAFRLVSGIAAR
jgi:hypothetical protein